MTDSPLLLIAVIAGVTELLTRLRAKDFWVVATIVSSGAVGAFFGAINYFPGVDVVQGLVFGLGASGVLKTLSVFGNKTTPTPSSVTEKAK